MPLGLVLDAHPTRGNRRAPALPCLLQAWPARPVVYADLPALARGIHRLRTAGGRERGLELIATLVTVDGSDSYPAFKVLVVEPGGDGGGDYVACVYALGRPLEALMAAIAAENPLAPEHRRAA